MPQVDLPLDLLLQSFVDKVHQRHAQDSIEQLGAQPLVEPLDAEADIQHKNRRQDASLFLLALLVDLNGGNGESGQRRHELGCSSAYKVGCIVVYSF